jgi:hypothetical protein
MGNDLPITIQVHNPAAIFIVQPGKDTLVCGLEKLGINNFGNFKSLESCYDSIKVKSGDIVSRRNYKDSLEWKYLKKDKTSVEYRLLIGSIDFI